MYRHLTFWDVEGHRDRQLWCPAMPDARCESQRAVPRRREEEGDGWIPCSRLPGEVEIVDGERLIGVEHCAELAPSWRRTPGVDRRRRTRPILPLEMLRQYWQYRLNDIFWIRFEPTMTTDDTTLRQPG